MKVLVAHRDAHAVERAGAEVWADDDLMFTTSVGTAIESRNLSRLHREQDLR